MSFSSKKPGKSRRSKSTVISAIVRLEGRFLPSRWLMPPTRAYEATSWLVSCVTVTCTRPVFRMKRRKASKAARRTANHGKLATAYMGGAQLAGDLCMKIKNAGTVFAVPAFYLKESGGNLLSRKLYRH